MEFSESSAFWVFNQVSNFAYTRYNLMIPHIRQKQAELEEMYINEVIKSDQKWADLLEQDEEKALEQLTAYSVDRGGHTVSEWKALYRFLFTRYMDGNVKTAVPGELNPKNKQPGYSEEWYRKIIEDTGDKFLYLEEE